MSFDHTWDDAFEDLPANDGLVSIGADQIRDLKEGTRERLQIEHEFGTAASGTDTGYHKKVTLKKVSGGPTEPASGYTELGYDSSDSELKIYPEGGSKLTVYPPQILVDRGGYATTGFKVKTLPIGVWDFSATTSLQITHGLSWQKIRKVICLIIDDTSSVILDIGEAFNSSPGATPYITSSYIQLNQPGWGVTSSYDSTTVTYDGVTTRGWMTIWYID